MRDEKATLGKRNMVRFGVAAHAADRPGISVDDCDRGKDGSAGDAAEKDFGRHRPQREVKLLAPGAAVRQQQHDRDAGDQADHPTPDLADRNRPGRRP